MHRKQKYICKKTGSVFAKVYQRFRQRDPGNGRKVGRAHTQRWYGRNVEEDHRGWRRNDDGYQSFRSIFTDQFANR